MMSAFGKIEKSDKVFVWVEYDLEKNVCSFHEGQTPQNPALPALLV